MGEVPAVKQVAGDGRETTSFPIVDRLEYPLGRRLQRYLLLALFVLLLSLMHCSQLVLYPLTFVPGGLREMYWDYIRYSKECFARLLVHLARRTQLVITADDSIDLDKAVKKNLDGKITGLTFSKRAVWMANHQQYADWIYLWNLFHFADLGGALVIILKASLKKVPIAGVAMQLFKFIFLASSWENDRASAGKTMNDLGRRATRDGRNLALLIFPEGTLVSKLTRPKSEAHANRAGTPDMKNMLLPRSTGLLFSLRTLLPVTPGLDFYDVTIGYPGLTPGDYAQSYYTLTSIFMAKQAPPRVHLHLRKYDLDQVPIGKNLEKGRSEDVTEEERTVFDEWLRERWSEKDALLDGFYRDREFSARPEQRIELALELSGIDDWMAIVSNIAPIYLAWRGAKLAWPIIKARYL